MRKRRGMEGGGGEFFICFTSRPSSSSSSAAVGGGGGSMRVPSTKSLMSPGCSSSSSVPSLSLSSSLTRRLRSSGSVKGGQSPMFPTSTASASSLAGRKKRGCAFEAAEPSSPKVTCIGQVRVKSKKKKMKQQQQHQAMMARSRSRDASFRRSRSSASGLSSSQRGRGAERACLPIGGGRNQRWMHQLPLSICEALKSFGCEFNCFSTSCAGSGGERSGVCFSFSDADKRDKKNSTYTATATAKEDEGREVLRLVVKERETLNMGLLVRERDLLEKNHQEEEEEEEEQETVTAVKKEMDLDTEEVEKGRVSVCIPPKNALLLMRCRSDPVRMAALANKFWGSPVVKIRCEKEDDDEDQEVEEVGGKVESDERVHSHHLQEEKEEEDGERKGTEELADSPPEQVFLDATKVVVEDEDGVVSDAADPEQEIVQPTDFEEANVEMEKQLPMPDEKKKATGCEEEEECGHVPAGEVIVPRLACDKDLKCDTGFVQREKEGEIKGRRKSTSSCSSAQSTDPAKAKEVVAKRRSCYSKEKKERRRHSFSVERESRRNSFSSEKEARRSSLSVDKQSRKRWSFSLDKEDLVREPPTQVEAKQQVEVDIIPSKEKAMEVAEPTKAIDEAQLTAAKVRGDEFEERKGEEVQGEERKRRELPDCLLLMMYEPKLSMEVSKETWVCSSDFLRRPNYNPQPQHRSSAEGKVVQVEEGSKCNEASDDRNEGKEPTPVAPDSTIHHPPTPPRPSPPLAAPPPSVSGSEQKLLKSCAAATAPYEPFVLTRCKSEPLKSSARLAPDWFWKSRHEPIGAAGVGF